MPDFAQPLIAPIVAFIVCLLVLGWMLFAGRSLPLDRPNARSLHVRPVARTGGVAILCGVAAAGAALWPTAWSHLSAALVLAVFSFLDDWRHLSVRIRLAAHISVATFFVWLVLPDAPWTQRIFATLTVVWMLNLYNFMDGSDGLAGGMAVIGFAAYAIAAMSSGDVPFASLSFSIAAAAGGFLLFNFHPARIFMGDSGSIPLGFLAAALGLTGWQASLWPLWFPLLVFSPFIVDASVTLARRLLRGERVWRAHREHYYQRLVRLGWGHRKVALAEYALMAACSATGLVALTAETATVWPLLIGWTFVYIALLVAVDIRWNNNGAHDEKL